MSVYRPANSKIWWFEFRFAGQRIRESTKTRSKTIAIDAERNRRRELEMAYNGVKRRAPVKLFGLAADEWLALKQPTLAPSSLRIERDNLKHIRPFFERRLVSDITAGHIADYQASRLAEKASPKTINLEVGTIRAILRRNKIWSEIQLDVRMLPTRDDTGKALSTMEEDAMLAACLDSRARCLYPAVMLALNTGMRYSEIRLLQWTQVDFGAKALVVGKSKTATGSGRMIPLNRRALAVLEMWSGHFPLKRPEHYVFPSEKYGAGTDDFKPCVYGTDPTKPINDWKEGWEGAKQRAGKALELRPATKHDGDPEFLPLKCRFHDLRHTACTRLLEAGTPYPVVSTIMGWSAATAIRMAKRYGHIGQKAMKDAMAALDRPICPPIPKEIPKVKRLGRAAEELTV